jgi:hypothetical protein
MADERSKTEIAADVVKAATGIAAALTNTAPQTFPQPPAQEVVERASEAYVQQREQFEAEQRNK